jgi:hypothetical protein
MNISILKNTLLNNGVEIYQFQYTIKLMKKLMGKLSNKEFNIMKVNYMGQMGKNIQVIMNMPQRF